MINKRILTKKSKLGFGKYKNETVDKLLKMRCFKALISPYYKLSSIDYVPEILNELGISEEWRIEKPGTDREKYVAFLIDKGFIHERTRDGSNNMKKEAKYTKGYQQSINQGRN